MSPATEVLVIGAGFAGSVLAYNLAMRGVKVVVLERTQRYPDVLRAEKIEHDQAEVFRRLGAFEHRRPLAPPLGITLNHRAGRTTPFDTQEQYGMDYHETVNNLRAQLLADVEVHIDEVVRIKNSDDLQEVNTKSGATYRSRLVVLASGGNEKLLRSIGVRRRVNTTMKSLTVGFDVRSERSEGFGFSGFNYFFEAPRAGIDYITLFRIGERMRVNMFTQWEPRTPELKRMNADTRAVLDTHFPELESQIGPFAVVSKLQFFKTEYYRLRRPAVAGVVAIGDEYQSVGPATGTGLTKVGTDVELLASDYISNWLATPGMAAHKIADFYASPRKLKCDDDSLERWLYYRDQVASGATKQWYRVESKVRTALGLW